MTPCAITEVRDAGTGSRSEDGQGNSARQAFRPQNVPICSSQICGYGCGPAFEAPTSIGVNSYLTVTTQRAFYDLPATNSGRSNPFRYLLRDSYSLSHISVVDPVFPARGVLIPWCDTAYARIESRLEPDGTHGQQYSLDE